MAAMFPWVRQIHLHVVHPGPDDLQLFVQSVDLEDRVGTSVQDSLGDTILKRKTQHVVRKFRVPPPLHFGELLEDAQLLQRRIKEVAIYAQGVHIGPPCLRCEAPCLVDCLEDCREQLCHKGPTLHLACVAGVVPPNLVERFLIKQIDFYHKQVMKQHLEFRHEIQQHGSCLRFHAKS
jgi:hypothetical protein